MGDAQNPMLVVIFKLDESSACRVCSKCHCPPGVVSLARPSRKERGSGELPIVNLF